MILAGIVLAVILATALVMAFTVRGIDQVLAFPVRTEPIQTTVLQVAVPHPADLDLGQDPSIAMLLQEPVDGVILRAIPYTEWTDIITSLVTGYDVIIGGLVPSEIVAWAAEIVRLRAARKDGEAVRQLAPLITPTVITRFRSAQDGSCGGPDPPATNTQRERQTVQLAADRLFRYSPTDCVQIEAMVRYYTQRYAVELITDTQQVAFLRSITVIVDRGDPLKLQSVLDAVRHAEVSLRGQYDGLIVVREVESAEDMQIAFRELDARLVIMVTSTNRARLIPVVNDYTVEIGDVTDREFIMLEEAYRREETITGNMLEIFGIFFQLSGAAVTRRWGNGVFSAEGRDRVVDAYYQTMARIVDRWRGHRFHGEFRMESQTQSLDGWLPQRFEILLSRRGERLGELSWIPWFRIEGEMLSLDPLPVPGLAVETCHEGVDRLPITFSSALSEVSVVLAGQLGVTNAVYRGEFGIGGEITNFDPDWLLYYDEVRLHG